MKRYSTAVVLVAGMALLAGCIETDTGSSSPPRPSVTQRPNGQVLVNFQSECKVLYNKNGRVVFRDSACNPNHMRRARRAYNNFVS